MTLNQVPQTFEEWVEVSPTGHRTRSAWDSGFAAGVASQQAANEWLKIGEYERVLTQLAEKDREIERLRERIGYLEERVTP